MRTGRLLERDEALARLAEAVESAARGAGRVVVVAGEAGVGKTTLVRRFVEGAGGDLRVLGRVRRPHGPGAPCPDPGPAGAGRRTARGVVGRQDTQRTHDAFIDHDTGGRLGQIAAPKLVLAGGLDMTSRPELCRAVAELIPGARFELMEEESHRPFQEVPDDWNARVDAFWREVEARPRR